MPKELDNTNKVYLSMENKRTITARIAPRYQKAKKKEKKIILDEYVKLTGYNRSYATYNLRIHGKKKHIKNSDIILVADARKKSYKRSKPVIYDDKVKKELTFIWRSLNYICGKRLAPYIGEYVLKLENSNELSLDPIVRDKLFKISSSTIDKLLKSEKDKFKLKGRTHTKPGTLLKREIEIRKGISWDENKPGFLEIDLVGHDGGDVSGEFAYTLDSTDICTQWTETRIIRNKARIWVTEALDDIKRVLPFTVYGIDSDNGAEFINYHLLSYCKNNDIKFTRGRSYEKNDSCHVEQKNYSIVRQFVGYHRYDTKEEINLITKLYYLLRFYTNFFQPVMKLIRKDKLDNKNVKVYDKAKTPYRRIMEHPLIDEALKQKLKEEYDSLNPIELRRSIVYLQKRIYKFVREKNKDKIKYVSKEEYERILIENKNKNLSKEYCHDAPF